MQFSNKLLFLEHNYQGQRSVHVFIEHLVSALLRGLENEGSKTFINRPLGTKHTVKAKKQTKTLYKQGWEIC